MTNEKILKKESLVLRKNALNKVNGDLTLTPLEVYFSIKKGFIKKTDEKIVSIPINSIINVKTKKAFGYGIEHLEITYVENGKEQKITFEHISVGGLIIGGLSRVEALYFAEWVNMIEDLRKGKSASTGLDDLEKLSELKKKGIITEEEFSAKKKQLLGL